MTSFHLLSARAPKMTNNISSLPPPILLIYLVEYSRPGVSQVIVHYNLTFFSPSSKCATFPRLGPHDMLMI